MYYFPTWEYMNIYVCAIQRKETYRRDVKRECVRFQARRKARRGQIEGLPVSFTDRRGDRVDKVARGGSED
jgi:hypothetical protein